MNDMAALPNPSASLPNPAKAASGTSATVPSEPPDKKTAAGAGRAVPASVHHPMTSAVTRAYAHVECAIRAGNSRRPAGVRGVGWPNSSRADRRER
jgi:hypothetical protein